MSITINGKEIEVTAGETVLQTARRAGGLAALERAEHRRQIHCVHPRAELLEKCLIDKDDDAIAIRDACKVRRHVKCLTEELDLMFQLVLFAHQDNRWRAQSEMEGSDTVTVVPLPYSLSSEKAPPWISTSLRATVSPSPEPCCS